MVVMRKNKWINKIEKLLIVWAVLASLTYFVQKATANYTFDYSFLFEPKYEERFESLLSMLPRGEKIDYITDPPGVFDKGIYEQRQRLANYLLAPYLMNGDKYVISDFHRPTNLNKVAKERDLIIVKDLETGVALFKRETLSK